MLVIGLGCAIATYAADPSKQTDTPMQKKMQKNEPSMQEPSQQKGPAGNLGSTRGTPDDGMKSKPTRKGDKGQTDSWNREVAVRQPVETARREQGSKQWVYGSAVDGGRGRGGCHAQSCD